MTPARRWSLLCERVERRRTSVGACKWGLGRSILPFVSSYCGVCEVLLQRAVRAQRAAAMSVEANEARVVGRAQKNTHRRTGLGAHCGYAPTVPVGS